MKKTIKAEDLRLGNYVYNTKGQIDVITIEVLQYILKEPLLHHIKGINVDHDILLRCGFKKVFDNTKSRYWTYEKRIYKHLNHSHYIQIDLHRKQQGKKLYYFSVDTITKVNSKELKLHRNQIKSNLMYLHELQNVYVIAHHNSKELPFK